MRRFDCSFGSRLLVLAVCASALGSIAPASVSASFLAQDPAKQDPAKQNPPKSTNELLDAEKEKLRLKDVEAWKKLQVKSLDQVVDVKKTTQAVELPASITEEEKTKMADLLQRAKDAGGGARTGRNLRELEKMGYPALVFLINHLREIDYKDPNDAMFGMQLNNSLMAITMGVNTGYVAIDIGEPMDPRKAQWNAMTVKEWLRAVQQQWPTREKFDEYLKARKAKKEAELEGEGKEPEKGKEAGK